ncbi:hypothetical protein I2I05_18820 [Hymenobacter sp. BT683]|uniref:Uncharacterized protein n=1 Tax=Hymenobacter jeongseonensis TaxID=2791027 RepID=A0ABS0INJ8_9BACT|nr:hypothetical protein [Hymenobacter jeongseonensis]MBF9239453.1 hypothetical protein [Hymenobacter jeongseonensis]
MIRFRLDERPYFLPERYGELTARQLLAAAPHLVHDSVAARLAIVRAWCPQLKDKQLRRLTSEQLWDLVSLVGWVWKEELDASALPSFKHRGRVYLLPEANLTDAVLVEYAMATLFFHHFARPRQPQPRALDQLVATLCRPAAVGIDENDPRWDGQRRERYHGKIAEARAVELADLPLGHKVVVLHHFLKAQRFVHRAYADLYKKPEPAGEGPAPKAQPKGDGTEVLEMLAELAERGTYGTYEQVAYTSLHTAFFNLAKQARRRREAERTNA